MKDICHHERATRTTSSRRLIWEITHIHFLHLLILFFRSTSPPPRHSPLYLDTSISSETFHSPALSLRPLATAHQTTRSHRKRRHQVKPGASIDVDGFPGEDVGPACLSLPESVLIPPVAPPYPSHPLSPSNLDSAGRLAQQDMRAAFNAGDGGFE